jgi:hypothetical protein
LGTVTKLEYRCDQIDYDDGKQLVHMVMGRIVDISHEKTEVERKRQHDEKAKYHLLWIHVPITSPAAFQACRKSIFRFGP